MIECKPPPADSDPQHTLLGLVQSFFDIGILSQFSYFLFQNLSYFVLIGLFL